MNARSLIRRMRRCAYTVGIFILLVAGCSRETKKSPNRAERLSGKTLGETIQENRSRLLAIPGVAGVEAGVCGAESCIKIRVEKKTPLVMNEIPLMLETWQVDVVERGSGSVP